VNPDARESERWERLDQTLLELSDRLTQLEELGLRGRAEFDDDSTLISLAAHSLLIQIGEAAKDLPETFRLEHPEVHWKPLIATRDRAAHMYNLIDWDVIFTTITRDIPSERAAIRSIIEARPGRAS
jgi:uncharacterized protein with HEPN domain